MPNGRIENLPQKLILRHYSATYGSALAAGGTKRWLGSAFGYTIPEGYYPIGLANFTTGSQYASLDYIQLKNDSSYTSNYLLAVKNTSSSSVAATNSVKMDVIFAPLWMIEFIDNDEVNSPCGDTIKEPVFKIKTFTCAYSSLASNARKAFTQANCNFFIPDGYEIFSLCYIGSGSMHVSISDCNPFSSGRFITINNRHTSSVSSTAGLGVVFINKKYKETDGRKGLTIEYNRPSNYTVNDGNCSSVELSWHSDQHSGIWYDPQLWNLAFKCPTSATSDTNFKFYCRYRRYNATTELWDSVYPSSYEIVSGGEYINWQSGSTGVFTIPENWNDKHIKIKFTFD